jgi:hypothetical protein
VTFYNKNPKNYGSGSSKKELKTKPFLIPQNADDYLGFKSKMQDEENMLINSIL